LGDLGLIPGRARAYRRSISVSLPLAAPTPRPVRLLDRVRFVLRLRHYSRRTEKAYVGWIRRFILFHEKRHPSTMGPTEIERFLSSLAVVGKVSASTQNQALCARSGPIDCPSC